MTATNLDHQREASNVIAGPWAPKRAIRNPRVRFADMAEAGATPLWDWNSPPAAPQISSEAELLACAIMAALPQERQLRVSQSLFNLHRHIGGEVTERALRIADHIALSAGRAFGMEGE